MNFFFGPSLDRPRKSVLSDLFSRDFFKKEASPPRDSSRSAEKKKFKSKIPFRILWARTPMSRNYLLTIYRIVVEYSSLCGPHSMDNHNLEFNADLHVDSDVDSSVESDSGSNVESMHT